MEKRNYDFQSVEWHTRILLNMNGHMWEGCIGDIIDEIFLNSEFTSKTQRYTGQIDEQFNYQNHYADIINILDLGWRIHTTNEEGISMWRGVSQIIRHPLYTGLIKVKLKSGREVTATTGVSFVMRREGTDILTAINGSELKVGDHLPVVWKMSLPTIHRQSIIINEGVKLDYNLGKIIGEFLYKSKEFPHHLKFLNHYCYSDRGIEKKIPNFSYNAPDEFVISLFGEFKFENEDEKIIIIEGERLTDGTIALLSRFNIFTTKKKVKDEWLVQIVTPEETFRDVVFDQILEIEEMKTNTYVYDLTVKGTAVFNTLTGNVMFDSSLIK